jgi:hypothetical protein
MTEQITLDQDSEPSYPDQDWNYILGDIIGSISGNASLVGDTNVLGLETENGIRVFNSGENVGIYEDWDSFIIGASFENVGSSSGSELSMSGWQELFFQQIDGNERFSMRLYDGSPEEGDTAIIVKQTDNKPDLPADATWWKSAIYNLGYNLGQIISGEFKFDKYEHEGYLVDLRSGTIEKISMNNSTKYWEILIDEDEPFLLVDKTVGTSDYGYINPNVLTSQILNSFVDKSDLISITEGDSSELNLELLYSAIEGSMGTGEGVEDIYGPVGSRVLGSDTPNRLESIGLEIPKQDYRQETPTPYEGRLINFGVSTIGARFEIGSEDLPIDLVAINPSGQDYLTYFGQITIPNQRETIVIDRTDVHQGKIQVSGIDWKSGDNPRNADLPIEQLRISQGFNVDGEPLLVVLEVLADTEEVVFRIEKEVDDIVPGDKKKVILQGGIFHPSHGYIASLAFPTIMPGGLPSMFGMDLNQREHLGFIDQNGATVKFLNQSVPVDATRLIDSMKATMEKGNLLETFALLMEHTAQFPADLDRQSPLGLSYSLSAMDNVGIDKKVNYTVNLGKLQASTGITPNDIEQTSFLLAFPLFFKGIAPFLPAAMDATGVLALAGGATVAIPQMSLGIGSAINSIATNLTGGYDNFSYSLLLDTDNYEIEVANESPIDVTVFKGARVIVPMEYNNNGVSTATFDEMPPGFNETDIFKYPDIDPVNVYPGVQKFASSYIEGNLETNEVIMKQGLYSFHGLTDENGNVLGNNFIVSDGNNYYVVNGSSKYDSHFLSIAKVSVEDATKMLVDGTRSVSSSDTDFRDYVRVSDYQLRGVPNLDFKDGLDDIFKTVESLYGKTSESNKRIEDVTVDFERFVKKRWDLQVP